MLGSLCYHAIRGVLLQEHRVIHIGQLWQWMTTQDPIRFQGDDYSLLECEIGSDGIIACLSLNDQGMVSFNPEVTRLTNGVYNLRRTLVLEFPEVILRMPYLK